MNRIEFPDRDSSKYNTLINDYKNIFSAKLIQKEQEWANWKKNNNVINIPETVEELIVADTELLADIYDRFKSFGDTLLYGDKQSTYKQLEKIFSYSKCFDEKIADFFMNNSSLLNISSCYYCDTSYINVYRTKRRCFDLDHYIPKQKCPILALSLFNFVPSCQVCNSRIKGIKVIGHNVNEYIKFNPAYEKYDFDINVRIRLRLNFISAHNFNNPNNYYIHFRCKNGFQTFVDFFQLENRYDFHKSEAIRIKLLMQKYPKSARTKIARLIGCTEHEIREDLFHEKFLSTNHRCFDKLTRDMLNP